ncbi:hypothetical protein ScPMuIL_008244 [Solemya velum]
MDANSLADLKPVVAVAQLTCTADKKRNFETCISLIKRASKLKAQIVFLPEACDYIGETKQQSMEMAETLDGDVISKYRTVAKEMNMWLSIGGFHQRVSDADSLKVRNTHVIIDNSGSIKATYDKTHLFDLDIKGGVRLCESDYTIPGSSIVEPVLTPAGRVGLCTCYDLRFPEMSLALTQQGAELLTFPSAFTQTTGQAHWEVLLRSRAIETQCYVIAAAQTGKHSDKRSSYGHAMIVDPWGSVVAQCHEGADIAVAEIDLDYLQKIRDGMPVWQHRRHDLYGTINVQTKGRIESEISYRFGQHQIRNSHVFFKSALSYAFVNIKPVLNCFLCSLTLVHVLVSSLRHAKRLADLSQPEVSDLFTAVQTISRVIEKHFSVSSLTVAIQDGPASGQTVEHVHVHILPRKPGDFPENDDIYKELQKHDEDMSVTSLRSEEEMLKEAESLREYFS